MHDGVLVHHRFCGPVDSGNGGYSAGRLAAFVDGPAEVTLRRPPPLDRTLAVEERDAAVVLLDGDVVVAEAVPAVVDVEPPEPVSLDAAVAAAARCPTIVHPEWHPFPSCFVCGPGRAEGDGLRVFPGLLDGRAVFAAPVSFPPDLVNGRVDPVLLWAALDCPSAFPMYMDGKPAAPYVLGRLAARIDEPPAAGPLVATAWLIGHEGRKMFSASALLTTSGSVAAVARATWIAV